MTSDEQAKAFLTRISQGIPYGTRLELWTTNAILYPGAVYAKEGGL